MTSPGKIVTKLRLTLAAFWLLFGVLVLDVLLGKAAIAFGWVGLPLLSDVAEFLLLLAAMVVFVMAALQREAATEQNAAEPDLNKGG